MSELLERAPLEAIGSPSTEVGAEQYGPDRREIGWSVRWRPWAAKSAWSLVDQGFTALTGFCVTFLLARWMAPDVYGAYAIAFAGYLFVGGLHNVIVLEPMSVLGPARHSDRMAQYLRAQMFVHWILAAGCAVLVLIVGGFVWIASPRSPLVGATLGAGLALGFLLFLFFARRVCYVLGRPALAVAGSGSCFALALAGLFVLRSVGTVRPLDAFCLVGVASLTGALVVIRTVGSMRLTAGDSGSARYVWTAMLKENWEYGVAGWQHGFVFGVRAGADVLGRGGAWIRSGWNFASDAATGVGDDASRDSSGAARAARIIA